MRRNAAAAAAGRRRRRRAFVVVGQAERKSKEEEDREKEMTQIKNAYLGVKKGKKKVAKISEKFRFSFDWANDEDTSVDLNPLYEKKHEALLLFGRGLRAGIDRREQLQKRDTVLQGRFADKQALPQPPPPPTRPVMAPPPPPGGPGRRRRRPAGRAAAAAARRPPRQRRRPAAAAAAGRPPPPPPPGGPPPPPPAGRSAPPPPDEPAQPARRPAAAAAADDELEVVGRPDDGEVRRLEALHGQADLDDLDDRDWRIFREDYEIVTKGSMRHPATGS